MIPSKNRRHMLDAALPLFARSGYHNTKVSDIVQKAGVAQGTFYWHFKKKEEIVLHILDEGKTLLLEVIHDGYREQAGDLDDMITSSKRLITRLFTFAKAHADYMQLLFNTGQDTDENIRAQIKETFSAIEEAFSKNIARAQELHMLPDHVRAKNQATILVSLVFGSLERWLFNPSSPCWGMEPAEIATQIVEFEFYGLQGNPRLNR